MIYIDREIHQYIVIHLLKIICVAIFKLGCTTAVCNWLNGYVTISITYSMKIYNLYNVK